MEALERLSAESAVPLVASALLAYHQPFGFAKVTLVKEVHSRNAESPMLVTLSGMVTLVKEVQHANA